MSQRPLVEGEILVTPGRTIGEGDVHLFAGLVGDYTPVHVDEVFAATTPFGTRIVHGPHALATAIGLLTQTGLLGERVIGVVNLNWNFGRPVMLGDTIRSRVTVENIRPSSKPGRRVATFVLDVINQREETVQNGQIVVVLRDD
jgi:acyl dehydratase